MRHQRRQSRPSFAPHVRKLAVESLEDRRLLAITVSTLSDLVDGNITPGNYSLREAIANAAPGETINFSIAGTINLTAGQFDINKSLIISGPGAAMLTINGQNSSRIFDIQAGAHVVDIGGLTLTGGRAAAAGLSGGAVRSQSTSMVSIHDAVINANAAGAGSPGAGGSGGGIWANGPLTVNNCTISNNTAGNGGVSASGDFGFNGGSGGGIFSSGSLAVYNSTINGNSSGNGGSGGLSEGADGDGGGIFSSGAIDFTNVTISGNSTFGRGGGLMSSGPGSPAIFCVTITANAANVDGDGGTGGGLFRSGAAPAALNNSIVAGNFQSATRDDAKGSILLLNSILGDNTGATVGDVGGNQIGTLVMPVDPLLEPLANNGGPTRTHSLKPFSTAINAGDPAAAAGMGGVPQFDQRGAPFSRVVGGRIDIGAFERPNGTITVNTVVDELDQNITDGDVSLRDALAVVIPGDTIAFSVTGAINLTLGELAIEDGITINGSGAEILTINAQQNSRIFTISAAAGNVTLVGLKLTGGKTTANDAAGRGGGIRSLSTSLLELVQCTVTANSTAGANAHGGGIFSNGFVSLNQSTLSGNSTAGNGAKGGGFLNYANSSLTQSTIDGNSTAGNSARGGGVYTGNLTVTQCTVTGNHTSGIFSEGGGLLSLQGALLTDSIISGNYTEGFSSDGGGICFAFQATIVRSIVSGNYTLGDISYGGGVGAISGTDVNGQIIVSHLSIADSTISSNRTEGPNGRGAGIFCTGNLSLSQSTVSGNSVEGQSGHGGGIFVRRAATITRSTIADNRSLQGSGGGVYQENFSGDQPVSISGSIIAGNTARDSSPDVHVGLDNSLSANFSLIGEAAGSGITAGAGSGNLLNVDPFLGPLGNNGGATPTHALLPGSPAINAGDPVAVAGVAGVPVFDQRGASFSRVNGRIDMGALESAPVSLIVNTLADFTDGSVIDGSVTLRDAVAAAAPYATIGFSVTGVIHLALGQIVIDKGLTIDGPGAAQLTIDGQLASRHFTVTAAASDVIIEGLTLTGGKTTADGQAGVGGAIRFLSDDALTLVRSVVSGNSTTGNFVFGGGIYSNGSVTALIASTVSGNLTSTYLGDGGGVFARHNLLIVASTIEGNSAVGRGGGGSSGGVITVRQSTVANNHTTNGGGGGLWASRAVNIYQSTISGNTTGGGAKVRGGGVYSSRISLDQSTVSGNSTTGQESHGGGLFAFSDVELIQSTISGNSTTGGLATGGGITTYGNLSVHQSTIAENHAGYRGGGAYQFDIGSHPALSVRNSIIAGNTAAGGLHDVRHASGTPLTFDYSLIGNASGSGVGPATGVGNLINVDPLLGPLIDNGGPTLTRFIPAGSPVINAGDPAATAGVNGVSLYDQRGAPYARLSGGRLDMGALETQPPPAPSADFNSSGRIDGFDFLAWQRGFGASGAAATRANGNADNDSDVDGADFVVWKAAFGNPAANAAASPAQSAMLTAQDGASALSPANVDAALAYQQVLDEASSRRPYRPRLVRAR